MQIVVVTGSPHRSGTTSILAEEFIKGAQAKGHTVYRFDAAFKNIHPCLGCDQCGMSGPCVHKDDIENDLIMKLVDADVIALVTPVHYFHVSSSLKTIIDRFYSRTGSISGKRSVMLAAAGSNQDSTFRSLRKYYATLSNYMRWRSLGTIFAPGCATKEQILKTNYPRAAYDLGYGL